MNTTAMTRTAAITALQDHGYEGGTEVEKVENARLRGEQGFYTRDNKCLTLHYSRITNLYWIETPDA